MVAIRLCVGCGKHDQQQKMLKVVHVDQKLVIDEYRKLAGRGAWVHPTGTCIASAVKRNKFARALRVSGRLDTSSLENRLENTMDK